MKTRVKMSLVLAAISAVSIGSAAMADDLTWDITGATPPSNMDGSGGWDLSSYSWYSGLLGTNVAWTNGSNAIFGSAPSGANAVNVDRSGAVAWAPDAELELRKIPFFVRGKARRNTERFAADRAVPTITVETLYEAKAHFSR